MIVHKRKKGRERGRDVRELEINTEDGGGNDETEKKNDENEEKIRRGVTINMDSVKGTLKEKKKAICLTRKKIK